MAFNPVPLVIEGEVVSRHTEEDEGTVEGVAVGALNRQEDSLIAGVGIGEGVITMEMGKHLEGGGDHIMVATVSHDIDHTLHILVINF